MAKQKNKTCQAGQPLEGQARKAAPVPLKRLQVFASPFHDAAENLALEQALLETQTAACFTHRDKPCISLGFNQDPALEFDAGEALREQVEAVRRPSGGGTVYRDEGCVCFTFIAPAPHALVAVQLVTDILVSLGIRAERNERNDIYVDGRKVSGYAWTQQGDWAVVHGSLLFSTDIAQMDALIGNRKAKYRGTSIESVHMRVTNLAPLLPSLDASGFQAALEQGISNELAKRGIHIAKELPGADLLACARQNAGAFVLDLQQAGLH